MKTESIGVLTQEISNPKVQPKFFHSEDNHEGFYRAELKKRNESLPLAKQFSDALKPLEEDSRDIIVSLRTRPLFEHEVARGCLNAISVRNPTTVAHKLEVRFDGVPKIESQSYEVDYAFGPEDDNDTIYEHTVSSLVPLVLKGGIATVFAYGQTGSGKTYTLTGLQELVAYDIIKQINSPKNLGEAGQLQFRVFLSYFEILGSQTFDLFNDREPLKIMEDTFGVVQVAGAKEVEVTSIEQFLELLKLAASYRKTESTHKNQTSSRSHSICRIRTQNTVLTQLEDGKFFLVDLAGSERHADSKFHTAERLKETKEINKSLMTLKECIRTRSQLESQTQYLHVPYRTSKLTLLLKDAFELATARQCRTVVIANISPSSTDMEHSLNTLRYTTPLRVMPPSVKPEPNPNNPATWTHEEMVQWIKSTSKYVDPKVLCPVERLYCAHAGAKQVTMTDYSTHVLTELENNIRLNSERCPNTASLELSWEDLEQSEVANQPFDLVIGADVTYDAAIIPLLVRVFKYFLVRGSEVILAATIRNQNTFAQFDASTDEEGIKVEQLPLCKGNSNHGKPVCGGKRIAV
ncbi:P-loop containing nucleoside triphosphate hydrolase protein [Basidiobolus meristosporus CBS 931.73]|uniref:Kinesin-like protein n=1 Tax=Basidiobolus meristosporus CBS 931.73 TaxID=1314790 RepID=A0A1Y1Z9L8_9FUNG|nr:P-loop containing nucleoside triphosphate hydrolase protein [Basidiobolus meristosporus CBS 931.73]|eukprot:ORY06485.1 P-loop containing nucleoside triphosphate hydrolase protein [Basidiobolus meristosporus CBS 931.73]